MTAKEWKDVLSAVPNETEVVTLSPEGVFQRGVTLTLSTAMHNPQTNELIVDMGQALTPETSEVSRVNLVVVSGA